MSDSAPDPLQLAQLLCTRICHDLAGPVGAVAAGVELTAGDPTQVDAETLGLIGNSSAAASRKLKFLRGALGVPGAASAVLGDLSTLMEGYLSATAGRGGPPSLQWPRAENLTALTAQRGPEIVPLLLNLCLVALEAQPACRRLSLEITQATGITLTAIAEGEPQRAAEWRPEILTALTGVAGIPTAKSVQAYYLRHLVARMGGQLTTHTRTSAAICSCFVP
jgi:histidine phosphotransferase ChpT